MMSIWTCREILAGSPEGMIKLVEICSSQPAYYSGNPQEAMMRMISPEKPRIYIE